MRWWSKSFLYEDHVRTNEWDERDDHCPGDQSLGIDQEKRLIDWQFGLQSMRKWNLYEKDQ